MVKRIKSYLNNLWATFQFWIARKSIQLDRDFEFYGSDGDLFMIKIKTGKFKDVIFSVSQMNVKEDDCGALLDFYTTIHNSADKIIDTNDKSFIKYINNVVRILLSEAVEEIVRNEQRRNVDPIELDEEREVHEESASVPKKRVPARKPRKKAADRDTEVHTEVQQPAKRRSNTAVARKRTKSKRTGV